MYVYIYIYIYANITYPARLQLSQDSAEFETAIYVY